MPHPGPGKLLAAFRQGVTATGCGNCPARPRLRGSQRCFGVCKIRSADATTTGKRSASSRFRALGAPIASRGARQLPLITRGIGRRRETRHSVAPRIHALSVHRVDRHPRLRGRVLSADRLYHGCGVVDFSGSGHGGRPHLAYEKRAKRHPGMVGVISHRPVGYLSHITAISGAPNRQARRPKNAAVFLVFGAGSLFRLTKSTRTPLENRWLFDGALYKK